MHIFDTCCVPVRDVRVEFKCTSKHSSHIFQKTEKIYKNSEKIYKNAEKIKKL